MTFTSTIPTELKSALDLALFSPDAQVILPGDEAYDQARMAWNLSVDQYPALVVYATCAQDVAEALRVARSASLSVAAPGTGHGVIRKADGGLLLDTSRLAGVRVDAARRTAYIGAGTRWGAVLEQAQQVGLAPLLGSSPDVGAIGYTLGGGMGWLARKYGLSTDSVNYFDLVTAAGEQVRVGATQNPDLFWGLRGGGGNFGVVTGMEIRLYPVSTVYAGNLYYPLSSAKEIFARFRAWSAGAPEELTSSFVILNIPPLPDIPEFMRGQSFAMIRGCYCGPVEEGEALLRYWRDWQTPIVDDFKARPFTHAAEISNDPVDPIPTLSSGMWLADLDDEVAETLLRYTAPQGGPPLLMFAEVRHAGGAIARVDPSEAAFSHRDARYSAQVAAAVPTPEIFSAVTRHVALLKQDLGPHLHGGVYMNFLEGEEARERTRQGFSPEAFARLQALKTRYDPENIFSHSFAIPPAR